MVLSARMGGFRREKSRRGAAATPCHFYRMAAGRHHHGLPRDASATGIKVWRKRLD
jgi:hypothetical protein